ncbi:MAG: hypothetical protein ACT4QA_10260 [Panacagrimonas sp.]
MKTSLALAAGCALLGLTVYVWTSTGSPYSIEPQADAAELAQLRSQVLQLNESLTWLR